MIDTILKIAKVKDIKSFYKKFPTEAAFMKAHGKEFKKAQVGVSIDKSSPTTGFTPLDYGQYYNQADKSITGSTEAERQQQAYQQAMLQATQQGATSGSSGGFDLGKIASSIGDIAKVAGSMSSGKRGINIPKAYPGTEVNFGSAMNTQWNPNGTSPPTYATSPNAVPVDQYTMEGDNNNISNLLNQTAGSGQNKPGTKVNWAQGLPIVEKVVGLVQKVQDEKEAVRKARQAEGVSKATAKATEQVDVDSQRQLSENINKKREAMMPVNTGQEFFPIYGVGTNPLARNGYMLQGGGEIQNTYAPNTLYDDLGFEPLNDSDIVKQYRMGGNLRQAQWGELISAASKGKFGSTSQFAGGAGGGVGQFANAGGTEAVGNAATQLSGGDSAGADIGGEVGGAIGSIWGPVGQLIGKTVGTVGGNLIDTNPEKIKNAQAATTRNTGRTAGANFGKGVQDQYNSYVRDGGNINPQLINYFGDHIAQDVYDFAHEGMDSLRTGGNIRQNLFTQQSMAMGGELKTLWGGRAEPISYNPYLPDGGETVMFKGNLHKESDDQGNTGIGVSYGNTQPSYSKFETGGNAEANVEVEGGEPAVKLQNGGQEESLVVFGNLKFDKKLAMATNDKELIELADEYGGKKFKRIEHHIANKTNRENKKIAKAISELNELDSTTSFDKLKLTSLKATIDGGNMKLKKYAADTQNLANYQEALNATADENGFIADNLARGEVKIDKNAFSNSAEFGTSIPKAQHGWDSEKETAYSNWLNEITSRIGSNKNNIDTPQNKKIFEEKWKSETSHRKDIQLEKNRNIHRDIYNKYLKDKRIGEMNLSYEDFVKNILHYGIEGAQTPEFKAWYSKTTGKPISPSPVQTTGKSTTKLAGDNATKREAAIRSSGQPPVAQPSGYVSKYGLVPWKGNTSPGDRYGMKTKSSFTGEEWDKIAENLGFTGQGNEEFQKFLLNNPQSKPLIEARHKELYDKAPFIDKKLGYGWASKELLNLIPPPQDTPKLPGMSVTTDNTTTRIPYTPPIEDKPKFPWIPALNTLIPYLRPTDQEQLDPNQLAGEMYAMSNNKVEPVQYQNYQPELTVPYDISLQDIMNENQADYRSAQRMSGYNPAALASLNAQKYGANQKVLAEQFRLNQAEKDKVYSENRNILNDAQLKNLQGLDQQYVRQQEALSNTKATTLAALNSISDKYAKNKLENRQLGVYENLYNYRYNDQMKAQNYNPFAQFDINGGMGTTGLEGLTEEEKAIAIADAKLNRAKKALATTKTTVRNGAIVQSANKL
jgi:hypothetical protein